MARRELMRLTHVDEQDRAVLQPARDLLPVEIYDGDFVLSHAVLRAHPGGRVTSATSTVVV